MGRRGFFRQDIGEHPPEIHEFLDRYWHPRGDGRFRRISIGALSRTEVRENARWFAKFLWLTAVVIPLAYWKWAGDRLTIFGWTTLFAVSAGLAIFGVVLLRSSGLPDPSAPKGQPKPHRKSNKGSGKNLP